MLNFLAKFLHRTLLNAPTSERIHDDNGWRYKTIAEVTKEMIIEIEKRLAKLEQHPFAPQNLKDRARGQKRVKGRFAK